MCFKSFAELGFFRCLYAVLFILSTVRLHMMYYTVLCTGSLFMSFYTICHILCFSTSHSFYCCDVHRAHNKVFYLEPTADKRSTFSYTLDIQNVNTLGITTCISKRTILPLCQCLIHSYSMPIYQMYTSQYGRY